MPFAWIRHTWYCNPYLVYLVLKKKLFGHNATTTEIFSLSFYMNLRDSVRMFVNVLANICSSPMLDIIKDNKVQKAKLDQLLHTYCILFSPPESVFWYHVLMFEILSSMFHFTISLIIVMFRRERGLHAKLSHGWKSDFDDDLAFVLYHKTVSVTIRCRITCEQIDCL